jgi:hypothetical protein
MRGTLNVWLWEKMVQFYIGPKFGWEPMFGDKQFNCTLN